MTVTLGGVLVWPVLWGVIIVSYVRTWLDSIRIDDSTLVVVFRSYGSLKASLNENQSQACTIWHQPYTVFTGALQSKEPINLQAFVKKKSNEYCLHRFWMWKKLKTSRELFHSFNFPLCNVPTSCILYQGWIKIPEGANSMKIIVLK